MNRFLKFALLTLSLLAGCAAPPIEGVEVHDAWARPAAQSSNGAVYLTIRSGADDEIVGIDAVIAEAVEMHESRMNGDVMEMRQLTSVPLPAREPVTFEPGGLHIMLVGLKQELKAGDRVEITLHFMNSEDLQVSADVMDTAPAGEEHPSNTH